MTGAASGIGRACTEALRSNGASVVGLDRNPSMAELLSAPDALGMVCDVTDPAAVAAAVEAAAREFGGLDILVSNAGIFPRSADIREMDDRTWATSLDVNLSGHMRIIRACHAFLRRGIDPAIVVIGSKNVPAPGPGAAAYSAAKTGLTQLARIAALEFWREGIRVNVIHPNAVFDTGIWNEEVLADRAKRYGMTVDQYKRNNVLGVLLALRWATHRVSRFRRRGPKVYLRRGSITVHRSDNGMCRASSSTRRASSRAASSRSMRRLVSMRDRACEIWRTSSRASVRVTYSWSSPESKENRAR